MSTKSKHREYMRIYGRKSVAIQKIIMAVPFCQSYTNYTHLCSIGILTHRHIFTYLFLARDNFYFI